MADKKIRFLMLIITVGILIKVSISFYGLFFETLGRSLTTNLAEAAGAEEQKIEENTLAVRLEKEREKRNCQDLIKLIGEKEKLLQKREEALRQEEERLNSLKRDIELKLEQIKQASNNLETLIAKKNNYVEEKIIKLAKVFESTPSEQAGPLLEKLDTKTAAQILLHMNGKKAGAAWGYVKPERALQIVKETSKLE